MLDLLLFVQKQVVANLFLRNFLRFGRSCYDRVKEVKDSTLKSTAASHHHLSHSTYRFHST